VQKYVLKVEAEINEILPDLARLSSFLRMLQQLLPPVP
jgi:hypothetical protein